jgi:hypothetical protein
MAGESPITLNSWQIGLTVYKTDGFFDETVRHFAVKSSFIERRESAPRKRKDPPWNLSGIRKQIPGLHEMIRCMAGTIGSWPMKKKQTLKDLSFATIWFQLIVLWANVSRHRQNRSITCEIPPRRRLNKCTIAIVN